MQIRKATSADKEAIFDLIRRSWHDNFVDVICYFYQSETVETQINMLNKWFDKYKKVLVVEENGKIIGTSILIDNYGRIFLAEIFIDPEYQNKGVGTKLAKKIMEGEKEVWTTINENNESSKHMFEKIGFKKVVTGSAYKFEK